MASRHTDQATDAIRKQMRMVQDKLNGLQADVSRLDDFFEESEYLRSCLDGLVKDAEEKKDVESQRYQDIMSAKSTFLQLFYHINHYQGVTQRRISETATTLSNLTLELAEQRKKEAESYKRKADVIDQPNDEYDEYEGY